MFKSQFTLNLKLNVVFSLVFDLDRSVKQISLSWLLLTLVLHLVNFILCTLLNVN